MRHEPAQKIVEPAGKKLVKPKSSSAFVSEINSWLGTPYKYGGNQKQVGTDCSGFVTSVFHKTTDVKLPRSAGEIYAVGVSVPVKDLKLGDLVFFKNTIPGKSGVHHVGIYLGDLDFVHASTTEGVVVSNLLETYYKEKYAGARRMGNIR